MKEFGKRPLKLPNSGTVSFDSKKDILYYRRLNEATSFGFPFFIGDDEYILGRLILVSGPDVPKPYQLDDTDDVEPLLAEVIKELRGLGYSVSPTE